MAELESIEYYLRLTTTPHSPHIALIGPRGVGKTSLLNAVEDVAKTQRLAAVRIDLNEYKTSAPGVFWQNFYATLLLTVGDTGCWGGTQGPIYAALFQMIHARKLAPIEDIVLQFPAVLAVNSGPLETLSCPDALIHRDLTVLAAELRNREYLGIVFLIDEADCLGQNRALIQMFRNIFQRLESCSLILAGTETVFPTLTDVFSPIPRQFHRIDVAPFQQWVQTRELLTKPFDDPPYIDHRRLLPLRVTIRALHELCGGDPSELQLYCHHMYRLVERGLTERMDLVPQLFREVVREFRAFAPADLGEVLKHIEQLPDNLLFESRWLRRRRLTVEENVELTVAKVELEEGRELSAEELHKIRREIQEGYASLYRLGITRDPDRLSLVGDTFTASFWKSYVEAEKDQRWRWNDASMAEAFPWQVVVALTSGGDAAGSAFPIVGERDGVRALIALRRGDLPVKVSSSEVMELIFARHLIDEEEQDTGGDAVLAVSYGGRTERWRIFYAKGASSPQRILERLESLLAARARILERHGVRVGIEGTRSWPRPDNREMQRLAYIGNLGLDEDDFGKSLHAEAIGSFLNGHTEDALALFCWMAEHNPTDGVRNNIAYCNMVLGNYEEARNQFAQMAFSRSENSWPIWQHNRGLFTFLTGEKEEARRMLREAMEWIREASPKFDRRSAACMLLLEQDGRSVRSRADVPIDAAILLNLFMVNALSADEMTRELSKRYAGEYLSWVAWVQKTASDQSAEPAS